MKVCTVKVTGSHEDIDAIRKYLEQRYPVIRYSQIHENQALGGCHQFLTLLTEAEA